MHPIIVFISCTGCLPDFMANQRLPHKASWIRTAPGASAMDTIGQHQPDLIIVHGGTESESGVLGTIGQIKSRFSSTPVFLVTPKSSESLAIGALKAGVDDYFKYPLCEKDLFARMDHLLPKPSQKKSVTDHASNSRGPDMAGQSTMMNSIRACLASIAETQSTVLLTGETGTGKDLAAEMIHLQSRRAKKPFVCVNCAALPENLVESELFGHRKGAFTGAVADKKGTFEIAAGGTLFLDEIGDMSSFCQAKILRSIEKKMVNPIGGHSPIPTDVRIVAATNKDLEKLIVEGKFRADLYYRINVARVHLPPLRERREDIPQLISIAIERFNRQFDRQVQGLTKDATTALMMHPWPGNIRELNNTLESAFIVSRSPKIEFIDLPPMFTKALKFVDDPQINERDKLLTVLTSTNWNKTLAAKKLSWSRMRVYRALKRYSLTESL